MKKILFLLTASIALFSFTVNAQSNRYDNRNGDEKIGKGKVTTDSAYHYIDSVTIKADEGGLIEVTVIGYAKDTNYVLTGVKKVRFNKRNGTLTMGSVIDEQAVVTDAALGTATFDLVAASNKIYVRIKGKDGENIYWVSTVKRKSIYYQ